MNSNLVLAHSSTLTGLTPGTRYNFQVRSRDGAGNLATTSGSFSTARESMQASAAPPAATGPCAAGAVVLSIDYKVERTGNNTVRLSAESWLTNPPNQFDYRSLFTPWVSAQLTFNGHPLASTGSATALSNGRAIVSREYTLQSTGVGVYRIDSTHWGKSTYCEQFGSNSIFFNRTESQTILRPARPDYSSTGGPVYFLGLGVAFTGNYTSSTTLSPGDAKGAVGTPQWIFAAGSLFGTLACGGGGVTCNQPVFTATKKGTGCLVYDVVIKTRYGGLESDPFHMFINAPHNFVAAIDPDHGVYWESTEPLFDGYLTRINYSVSGLCLTDPRMSGFKANEFFGNWENDYPNANWNHGAASGWDLEPGKGVLTDSISFASILTSACSSQPCEPTPITGPQTPGYVAPQTAVHHVSQRWFVGSDIPGSGTPVQTNTLRRYRNKAQHEDIVTPVP